MRRVLFARQSYAKLPQYRLLTTIEQTDDERFVYKQATTPAAIDYLHTLLPKQQLVQELIGDRADVILGELAPDGRIRYPFQNLPTLHTLIESQVEQGAYTQAFEILSTWLTWVDQLPSAEVDVASIPEIRTVFGGTLPEGPRRCLKIGLIDLLTDNVLYDHANSRYSILDHEFVFAAPIPVELVLFRIVFYQVLRLQRILRLRADRQPLQSWHHEAFLVPEAWPIENWINKESIPWLFACESAMQKSIGIPVNLIPQEQYTLTKRSPTHIATRVTALQESLGSMYLAQVQLHEQLRQLNLQNSTQLNQIQGLEEQIREQQNQNIDQRQEIVTNQQLYQATQQELTTTQAHLQAIQSTISWKIAQRLSRMRGTLAPLGSRQDKLLRKLVASARLYRSNGMKGIARKLLQHPTPTLQVHIDSQIPNTVSIASGMVLSIDGWCFHTTQTIQQIGLSLNGGPIQTADTGLYRPDVAQAFHHHGRQARSSIYSGFQAFLPIDAQVSPGKNDIIAHVTLKSGVIIKRTIASIDITSSQEDDADRQMISHSQAIETPKVAICMTTYNPPVNLFERQISSIKKQTFTNWVCLIQDDQSSEDVYEQILGVIGTDQRFIIERNVSNLGFYHNFERCLARVTNEFDYVALSDQDDIWYPDKIDALLNEFTDSTTLVYSDMHITDTQGNILSDSYWSSRKNGYRDLAALLVANTVTGAASLFRRSLLRMVLPFPQKVGGMYHDHWIACTALACGQIRYVDRPLYAYIQHNANVIGHFDQGKGIHIDTLLTTIKESTKILQGSIQNKPILDTWSAIYSHDVVRLALIARNILLRVTAIDPYKYRVLQHFSMLNRSKVSQLWVAWHGITHNFPVASASIGNEFRLIRGFLWKLITPIYGEKWYKHYSKTTIPTVHDTINATTLIEPHTQSYNGLPNNVLSIQTKIAPLKLQVRQEEPERINLLVPSVDLQHFFGGYITKFNLAVRLHQNGYNIRIITVDKSSDLPANWKQQLRSYQGLEQFPEEIEILHAADRNVALSVSKHDHFIATTWWTAHIAHAATCELGVSPFLYLIQEYEAFTFPMGSYAALADESYRFQHHAIFSTDFLRNYFRNNRIGVYSDSTEYGDKASIAFNNTITDVGVITLEMLKKRTTHKLVFYARPEQHAARNMFEIGILGLIQAIRSGCFKGEWEFYGIGTVEGGEKIRLTDDHYLHLLRRQSQNEYARFLRSCDIGLSLIYTPHPSLPPIEMASAGMLVVTNTFNSKTADQLKGISENIIGVDATIADIATGLQAAVGRLDSYAARIAGANVAWSRNWNEAFDNQALESIRRFLNNQHIPLCNAPDHIIEAFLPSNCVSFRSIEQYLDYRTKNPNEIELILLPPNNGICPVCGKSVVFSYHPEVNFEINNNKYINLREGNICELCHLNNRQRLMMYVIDHAKSKMQTPKIYVSERVTPFYDLLSLRYSNVTGSEYLGADKRVGVQYRLSDSSTLLVEHQDILHLSYEDESFNIVITGDVLEHVPDYQRALQEIYRVLKSGGLMISSIPFSDTRAQSILRARVRDDGSIEHILPPEIHGNPLSAEGSLAFHSFGWDILGAIRAAGFNDAAAVYLYNRQWGFVHSNSPVSDHFMGPFLFVGYKNSASTEDTPK